MLEKEKIDAMFEGGFAAQKKEEEKPMFENLKKLAGEKVSHPSHYNRPNSMECIDEMVEVFGKEAVMNFCLCNVWKYRYRAGDKNGQTDIDKSDWYMKKYMELKSQSKIPVITVSN